MRRLLRLRSVACIIVVLLALQGAAQDFDALSRGVAATVRSHYEHLHAHPELGKQETSTAAYLKAQLTSLGFSAFEPVPGLPTAVITTYDAGKPGRTVALRADIDARRQQEATGLPYASRTPGVMHSCGHDAHTAILLGVAELLPQVITQGRVVLVFQPAEETAGGADDIMSSGILQRLGVDAIIAQHVVPSLPVGTIQLSAGPVMAGSNYFTITITGQESHAAAPYAGDDITTCTAGLAHELPTVFTRRTDIIAHPAVLSVTYVSAGAETSLNVLPTDGTIKGTIRSFHDIDDVIGETSLRDLLSAYVTQTATRCGATSTITIREASPPTANNEALTKRLLPALQATWPTPIGPQPRGMFSEDFAYYTTSIPSAYFSLGIQQATLGQDPVHTTTFTVHPDALTQGVKLLLTVASNATQP